MKIDFVWICFVGVTLLGYTEREVGHFTFKKWNKLYEYYKKFHDFETKKYLFYENPSSEEESSDEWFTD